MDIRSHQCRLGCPKAILRERFHLTRLANILLAAMFAFAACTTSSGAPTSAAAPTSNVTTETNPAATPLATQEPTEAPTIPPTPEPSASVSKVRETIRPCASYGTVQAMIMIELVNEGTGWAELRGGDYTVYDSDENVVGTGNFSYSYPRYLAPGAKGYLADSGYFEDTKIDKLKRVEADGGYDEVAAEDVIQLKFAKVQIKRESYGDGLHTTGTVTNTSTTDVDSAHVASFFLDAKGRPIGFAYTNLIDNLTAGKTKGFETVDSTCPVKRSSVDKVVTLGGDDNY